MMNFSIKETILSPFMKIMHLGGHFLAIRFLFFSNIYINFVVKFSQQEHL